MWNPVEVQEAIILQAKQGCHTVESVGYCGSEVNRARIAKREGKPGGEISPQALWPGAFITAEYAKEIGDFFQVLQRLFAALFFDVAGEIHHMVSHCDP